MTGQDGTFLWLVNPTNTDRTTRYTLGGGCELMQADGCSWPIGAATPGTHVTVPAKNVVILRLANRS